MFIITLNAQVDFNFESEFAIADYADNFGGSITASSERFIAKTSFGYRVFSVNSDGSLSELYTMKSTNVKAYDLCHTKLASLEAVDPLNQPDQYKVVIYDLSNTSQPETLYQFDVNYQYPSILLFPNFLVVGTASNETSIYSLSSFQLVTTSELYRPKSCSKVDDTRALFRNYGTNFTQICQIQQSGEITFEGDLGNSDLSYIEHGDVYAIYDYQTIDFIDSSQVPGYQGSHSFDPALTYNRRVFWVGDRLGVLRYTYPQYPRKTILDIYDTTSLGASTLPLVTSVELIDSPNYDNTGYILDTCQWGDNIYIASKGQFLYHLDINNDDVTLSENLVNRGAITWEGFTVNNNEIFLNTKALDLELKAYNVTSVNNITEFVPEVNAGKFWFFGENNQYWVRLNRPANTLHFYTRGDDGYLTMAGVFSLPTEMNQLDRLVVLDFDGERLLYSYINDLVLMKNEAGAFIEKWRKVLSDDRNPSGYITSKRDNLLFVMNSQVAGVRIFSYTDTDITLESTSDVTYLEFYSNQYIEGDLLTLANHHVFKLTDQAELSSNMEIDLGIHEINGRAIEYGNNIIWAGYDGDDAYDELKGRHLYVHTNNNGTYEKTLDLVLDYKIVDIRLANIQSTPVLYVLTDASIQIFSLAGTPNNDLDITPIDIKSINYPNPFNPETTISYDLPKAADTRVEIYNVRGQLVNTLVNSKQTAGNHKVIWTGFNKQGQSVTSGVYYYKVKAGNYETTKKITLIK
jgi:hypothetical protein